MANEVRLIDVAPLIADGWVLERHGISNCLIGIRSLADVPTIDPESLRPKGHWDIRCDYCIDSITREADESYYLECSECKRKVWDINQMAAMNGEYRKLIEQYPYCHCGAKMEG